MALQRFTLAFFMQSPTQNNTPIIAILVLIIITSLSTGFYFRSAKATEKAAALAQEAKLEAQRKLEQARAKREAQEAKLREERARKAREEADRIAREAEEERRRLEGDDDDFNQEEEEEPVEEPKEEPVEEPTEEPEEEPTGPEVATLDLSPEGSKKAGNSKLLTELINTACSENNYTSLKEAIEEALEEAYPGIIKENMKSRRSKIKSDLPLRALRIYETINIAQVALKNQEPEMVNSLMNWLISGKSTPSINFMNSVEGKFTHADSLDLMRQLFFVYAENPKFPASNIKPLGQTILNGSQKKLYPRSRNDIRKKIAESQDVKKARNEKDRDIARAINLVNLYRYLCGLNSKASDTPRYNSDANKAANACLDAQKVRYNLGNNTEVCNLHRSNSASIADTVHVYMEDADESNHEKRSRRGWVLWPASSRFGFGSATEGTTTYHAMRVMDSTTTANYPAYSYPGRGFFPKEYLHGTGWSYYVSKNTFFSDEDVKAKVEMWRLPRSVSSPPSSKMLASAKKVPILETHAYTKGHTPNVGSIIFMPDYKEFERVDGKLWGTYWIKITWGEYSDEYVVDLY